MFQHLVDFSLKNKAAVLALTAIVAVWGWLSFRDLTVEAFPDPTETQVQVITLYPGQPAEEVERQLGLPLERALNGIPQLSRLRNLSLFGLSYVTLTFNDGTDGLWARQQVLERLRDADLPDGIVPQLGPYATPIGEVYRYTLAGAGGDPMKLRTLQDWVVRPAFLRVNGVADVVSIGGLQREIHVQPDPSRLAAHGLTLASLEQGIKNGSVNASGGVLERGAEQFVIRSEGLFTSVEDLKAVRLATEEGTPVFLKDVATVTEGWSPRQGVVSRNEAMDTVQGVVLMRRGENPSAVLKRVRAAVQDIDRRLAADGVKLDPFYDRTDLVGTTLAHRGAQPPRGRGAGHAGPLRVPARSARGAGGGDADPAVAAHLVHLPPPAGDERQPPLDGGGGLRGHRRRRRGHRRGDPRAHGAGAELRRDRGADDPGGDGLGRPADGLRPADHHRRLSARSSSSSGWRAASSPPWRTRWSRRSPGPCSSR